MHPTPTEHLRAVRHLIERAQADPDAAAGSAHLLTDAVRLLRRLERSWPARQPFLVDDNRRAIRLLGELAPDLGPLAHEVAAASDRPPVDGEDAAHERNLELQALLARAVHVLADDAAGDRGRARIAEHVRQRIAADPTLNRDPAERPPIER
ncbi:MAG: hypothetical protein ACFCVK_23590 [Acidimicrobiales bacterium]